MSLKDEPIEIFGAETVELALLQEVLAQRTIQKQAPRLKQILTRFCEADAGQQAEMAAEFDEETRRAVICALLTGSASKVVQDLGKQAVADRRAGRPVLGGHIQRSRGPGRS